MKNVNDKIQWVSFEDSVNKTLIHLNSIIGICKTSYIRFPGTILSISKYTMKCKIDGQIFSTGIGDHKPVNDVKIGNRFYNDRKLYQK